MFAAAPPPEGLGGGAGQRVCRAAVREALCASAVRLAQACGYRGAGTLEYLYDEASGEFFFIEMNTRIQVEHPVTEMVTGVDLVQEMIRIAGGEPLPLRQADIVLRGHAIEVRINAEDAANGLLPVARHGHGAAAPGRLRRALRYACSTPATRCRPSTIRLLGKLIVWDDTRAGRWPGCARALGELAVDGVKTTVPLHAALARDPDVRPGASIPAGSKAGSKRPRSTSGRTKEVQRHDATLFVRRRRAHLRRGRRGDVARRLLQEPVPVQGAAGQPASRASPRSARPMPRFQVKFNPDVIAPDDLLAEIKALEAASGQAEPVLKTRIVEIPVFYNDPWTHETLMRFRERHQEPERHRPRLRGAHQRLTPSVADFIARPCGLALVRLHGGLRGRPAVHVPDGRARRGRSRCRNTCGRAPTRRS